jgi:ketol-acid reductoisomerase
MNSYIPTKLELITLYEDMEYNFQEFSEYVDAYCNKYLDEKEKKIVDNIINKDIKTGLFISEQFISEYDKNGNFINECMENEEDSEDEEDGEYDDLEEWMKVLSKKQKVVAHLKTVVDLVA